MAENDRLCANYSGDSYSFQIQQICCRKFWSFGNVFLVVAALGDGLTGFSQQLYKQYYTENGMYTGDVIYPKSVFNFYTYVFAAFVLLLVWFVYAIGKNYKSGKSECASYIKSSLHALRKPLPHIVIMAICLYGATYFQTAATSDYGMPSQVLTHYSKEVA